MEPIAIGSRTLSLSEKSDEGITFTVTGVDVPSPNVRAHGESAAITSITVTCVCSGTFISGPTAGKPFTDSGANTGTITANTQRVHVNGQDVIRRGDNVTINCTGTVPNPPPPGTTLPATASVKVTVDPAGQDNVNANDE